MKKLNLPCREILLAIAFSLCGFSVRAAPVLAESAITNVQTLIYSESGLVNVDTRTGYDIWIASENVDPFLQSMLASAANDGVTNLVKYAFNLEAKIAGAIELAENSLSGMPVCRIVSSGMHTHPQIHAIRRKDDKALVYLAEFSTNLSNWTQVEIPTSVVSINSVWERVTFDAPAEFLDASRCQARVRLNYLPE